MTLRPELIQTQWARLIVRTLQHSGVRTVVVSPGSRSAPLALAIAEAQSHFDVRVIVDERSAGFYALGVARANGSPVALVCTSGTAAAHYLPAVIEAAATYVPLVVLTADRPAELHYCGAPQTIDQHGLFGRFARAALQLGTPDAAPLALRGCRRTVAHAVGLALGPIPGPVQLNIPLRKPLEPAAPQTEEERDFVRFSDNIADATPIVSHATVQATVPAHVTELIAGAKRGVIAVGNVPAYDRDLAAAVAELARATGFVVVAESGSQLRLAGRCISHHDALVSSAARAVLAPDLVVQIGGELASSGWIAARVAWSSATTVMLDRFAQHDPHSQAAAILVGDLATTVRALTAPTPSAMLQTRAAYAATWKSLDAVASASVETALTAYPTAEPGFVKAAVRALPNGAGLLLGNSLPIRVVDQVCSPTDDSERWVVTQRGANGIDGLLAGAAGAVASRGPAMLLLGDVSFSHDVGSLAVLRTCNVPLVVVVIDNAGGRIFDTLPIATATEVPSAAAALTPYFTTPPGLDIGAVARAFGLNTIEATTPEATHNAVRAAFAHAGATIIVAHCSSNGAHAVQTAVVTSLNAHVASETKTEKS